MNSVFRGISLFFIAAVILDSCAREVNQYDDEIKARLSSLENRMDMLEDAVEELNTSTLPALRALVYSLESRQSINRVLWLEDGYELVFSDGSSILISDGKDGKDGSSSIIGITYINGQYYWTLNGDVLLDGEGNPILVSGVDGVSVIPLFRLYGGVLQYSVDDGETWVDVVIDSGVNSSLSVSETISYSILHLSDGTEIPLLKTPDGNTYHVENRAVQGYNKVKYNNNDYSYTCIEDWIPLLNESERQIPGEVSVPVPLNGAAESRLIEVADNPIYRGSIRIPLDLHSESISLTNLEPGKVYYYRSFYNNLTGNTLSSGCFETIGKTRMLKIDADNQLGFIQNIRDLGGFICDDGRMVRYGVLIRGSELDHFINDEAQDIINEKGVDKLKMLGVKAHIDLRASGNESTGRTPLAGFACYENIPLQQWFFHMNIHWPQPYYVSNMSTAIRQIITYLKDNKTVYFSCMGGADRTGALSAIIEGLCGVSENDINHDYELTSFSGLRNRNRNLFLYPDPGTLFMGDFQYAIQFIKGLVHFNGVTYVKVDGYYYNASASVENFSPSPITDSGLIQELDNTLRPSFKDQFKLLMQLGEDGLTDNEIKELQDLLLS